MSTRAPASVPGSLHAEFRQMPRGRLHGLDWLRAGATLLVVALHAGIAYQVAPLPGLVWATNDPVGSLPVDAVTWWIDAFIMPLFFVLSGFVSYGLMRQAGPKRFLVHRTRRVLVPLLLGCVLILPLDLYVWLLGWAAEGKIPLRKLRSLSVEGPLADGLWGLSHLWYLQYLWLFCLAAAGVMWLAHRSRRDHFASSDDAPVKGSASVRWRPPPHSLLWSRYADDLYVALLTISGLALWWEPQLVIGFRHSWWPQPANVLFYLPWFVIGWIMAVRQRRKRVARGEWRLVGSGVVFAVLWPMIHEHVATELSGELRVVLVTLFVLHSWLAVTGWFGVCLRRLDREPPAAVKYVAAASFWIYLLHHPVVGLAQVSLRTLAVPVALKFLLTLAVGVALPLLTYEVLVRRTWIGLVLNGRRDVRTSTATEEQTEERVVVPPRRAA